MQLQDRFGDCSVLGSRHKDLLVRPRLPQRRIGLIDQSRIRNDPLPIEAPKRITYWRNRFRLIARDGMLSETRGRRVRRRALVAALVEMRWSAQFAIAQMRMKEDLLFLPRPFPLTSRDPALFQCLLVWRDDPCPAGHDARAVVGEQFDADGANPPTSRQSPAGTARASPSDNRSSPSRRATTLRAHRTCPPACP